MTDDRSPRLIWTEDGSPRSGRFGDIYFSKEDGLAESRAVFLTGCGLPEAWRDRRRFTVAELGFGSGLNIAALLTLWRETRPPEGRLHIFSIEGFPLARDEAARALSAWPEIADAAEVLLAGWPSAAPGVHRLDLPDFDAVLDLAIGPVERTLAGWSGPADAWFLDGFSPATNPEMWSEAVLDLIAARSAPDARLATFTIAGAVRRGLAARGFAVDKRPGHGRKRERLEARRDGATRPETTPRVAVIGAGIAGAALVRAFRALGVRPVLVEAEAPGAGGSGFPAALVTPRLDAGDAEVASLYAQALATAAALYSRIDGAVTGSGVLQLEGAPRDAGRFAKIAEQPIWPSGAMTPLDAAACSERLGEAVETGGLWMQGALAVRPAAVLAAWLDDAETFKARVEAVRHDGEAWMLSAGDEAEMLRADVVVVAAGWGAAALLPDTPLAPVRGQADWIDGVSAPPVAWGGYAAPTGEGLLFGATHERGETRVETSDAASARNLATLAERLPGLARTIEAAPRNARAAMRATTPDRLPLAGAVEGAPNLFVLGGLGSRGFCAAPLLAEHVAALALGAPSPLPLDLARRIAPDRRALAQPGGRRDG